MAGHRSPYFARGTDLVVAVQNKTLDVCLLDWNVPGLSGMDVVQRVRHGLKSTVPILFLSARTSEEDVVGALREGADDYMVKPLSHLELIARLEGVSGRWAEVQTAAAPAVELGRL